MTIVECIRKVLASENRSLTISQIYEMIYQQGLYGFNSKDPRTIVRQQIRRHCVGLTFPSAMPNKYFRMTEKGKYCLVTELNSSEIQKSLPAGNERISEEHIQDFHLQHIEEVRQNLIETLLNTDPAFFEQLILDLLLKMGKREFLRT